MAAKVRLFMGVIVLSIVLAPALACGAEQEAKVPAGPSVATEGASVPGAGKGAVVGSTVDEPAAVTVDIRSMQYQPDDIKIKTGATVAWTFNDGAVPHTVTAFDRSFDSGIMTNGRYVLRFNEPGTYCYQCTLHPGLNRCGGQGAAVGAAVLELIPTGDRIAPAPLRPSLNLAGGGGHMQGRIIVER